MTKIGAGAVRFTETVDEHEGRTIVQVGTYEVSTWSFSSGFVVTGAGSTAALSCAAYEGDVSVGTGGVFDLSAPAVTVVATDAGRTLIQVIDNGSGMSPDDALLCFERHATSKIATAEDLEKILTYGFRGEALASIAAVAEVTLKTRRPKDEVGTQVRISSYNHIETSQVSAPVGSNFAVRNLFYNTPARRKFLKSDNVELKHIVEEFSRIALTRPDIAFTLTHNGRDLYVLKPAKSLKFRAQDLLGANVVGELVDIEAQTSLVRITGFVGRPDTAKKTLGNQFFFVNGRYFRSPYLHKAVMKAYEDFIPEGVTPSYFLYLDIDPHSVDVNIHPTKTEIKFEDDSLVFQILYASIKETLGKHAFGASIDFNTEGAVQMPVLGPNFDQYHPTTSPAVDFDPDYNPFESSGPAPSFDFPKQESPDPDAPYVISDGENYSVVVVYEASPVLYDAQGNPQMRILYDSKGNPVYVPLQK